MADQSELGAVTFSKSWRRVRSTATFDVVSVVTGLGVDGLGEGLIVGVNGVDDDPVQRHEADAAAVAKGRHR
jgi:hypothetical protein